MKTSDRWVLAQWVLLAILGLTIFTPRSPWLLQFRPLGLALIAIGGMVAASAVISYVRVNRSVFHVSPEPDISARMIRSGIYSLVRHPTYSGVICAAVGFALLIGSLFSLAMAVVVTFFFYLKSRYEDGLLMRNFSGYASYLERTGRFLPRFVRRRG